MAGILQPGPATIKNHNQRDTTMNCAIINQQTQTTYGQNGSQNVDKVQFSGSALQTPDVSRLTLETLMRRQMRPQTGTARGFWSHFMTRHAIANHNIADLATP